MDSLPEKSSSGPRRRSGVVRSCDANMLSLAQRITRELALDQIALDSVGVGEVFSIDELRQMKSSELAALAAEIGVIDPESQPRDELVLQLVCSRIKSGMGLMGEGTLQILPDGFGFLRSVNYHYLACPDDIYVSPSQIRRFRLRTGAVVRGQIRPPKSNERFFALLRIDAINELEPERFQQVSEFDTLTPLYPDQRIELEHDPQDLSTRVVNLFAPIGFGQRGLIVSPPRAGKTILLQAMTRAVLANYPNAYVIVLLVDERPEEVTDMEREVRGPRCEVVSSTFDESPSRHIHVAEMVLEKAKRMVEVGVDVVVFLDSITRLAQAWNNECEPSGKTLSGGLDANAMQRPKAFFGSARKVEEGGSLTIIATALINTGSKMSDVIFEEFKGTGNMEIVLDPTLVERRIWPAIDLTASGTRREEKLLSAEENNRVYLLRRHLSTLNAPDAMEFLLASLRKHRTNAQLLQSIRADRGAY
jgi:transcription termination factor Rho